MKRAFIFRFFPLRSTNVVYSQGFIRWVTHSSIYFFELRLAKSHDLFQTFPTFTIVQRFVGWEFFILLIFLTDYFSDFWTPKRSLNIFWLKFFRSSFSWHQRRFLTFHGWDLFNLVMSDSHQIFYFFCCNSPWQMNQDFMSGGKRKFLWSIFFKKFLNYTLK